MTIHQHTMHIMEFLNGYLTYLPTLMDGVMEVASTEMGYKPFNEAMLTGMIMGTCLIAWRSQYNLTHKTVPKFPRTMLLDLENTKKIFVENYNKKAKANKAKVATASKAGHACPGSAKMGAHLIESLRRAVLLNIAAGARLIRAPYNPRYGHMLQI
jgi:hypothetical protein